MNRPDRGPGRNRDSEHGYYRAMLVLTVVLAVLATVVAVLVAMVPDDGGDDGPQPVPTPWVTSAADGVDGRGEHPRESLGGRDEQPARG